jgi:uracil-DNA glycosylase family 4
VAFNLEDVYEGIREDDAWDHLRQPGIVLVKGRGQKTNPLAMVVGEAPGATENTHRRPFCGPSGRVLMGLMSLAGLSAEVPDGPAEGVLPEPNAFITNVVKYRPPGNRTPNVREINFGTKALRDEWTAIGRPRLIVAVGSTARAALVPPHFVRLDPGDFVALPDGRTFLFVQYHPAWGLRQGDRGRSIMEHHWEEMGLWIQSQQW